MRLINKDCLEVLPTLKENSVDLAVTSPPYNINVKYNKYKEKIFYHKTGPF